MSITTLTLTQIKSNFAKISLGETALYFSYATLVAFEHEGRTICIENQWGPTTGKHLNYVEADKKKRVTKETFDKLVNLELRALTLA